MAMKIMPGSIKKSGRIKIKRMLNMKFKKGNSFKTK